MSERAKRKGTPEYVYAPSQAEAQRLLDESYLQKFVALPFNEGFAAVLAERDSLAAALTKAKFMRRRHVKRALGIASVWRRKEYLAVAALTETRQALRDAIEHAKGGEMWVAVPHEQWRNLLAALADVSGTETSTT